MTKESLEIILNLYKRDAIGKEEAKSLIDDLYNKSYYPAYWYTTTYPLTTDQTIPSKYTVTCENNKLSELSQ